MSGHQGRYWVREILNSISYQNRTGCQWAYLPHDLPPKSATSYFAVWRDDGTDQAIHDLLRCQAREKAGRREDLSAIILDTQWIRVANQVPAATTGKDVPGRKRGLAVDALGLIITGGGDRGAGHRHRDRGALAGQARRADPDRHPGMGGRRVQA